MSAVFDVMCPTAAGEVKVGQVRKHDKGWKFHPCLQGLRPSRVYFKSPHGALYLRVTRYRLVALQEVSA